MDRASAYVANPDQRLNGYCCVWSDRARYAGLFPGYRERSADLDASGSFR